MSKNERKDKDLKKNMIKSSYEGSSYDGEFDELNSEIDKIINWSKINREQNKNINDSFEENSSLNTTPTPIVTPIQHFNNKIKDLNQQDCFHNFFALTGNRNDDNFNFQKKIIDHYSHNQIENNPYQKIYLQNFINNNNHNNNNFIGIYSTPKLNSNFNFQIINSPYYNNKFATPTFDFIQMNTQLTPIINNNQFLTPIQPFNNYFQSNYQNPINYHINNNSKFFSVNVNNVTPTNQKTNDEIILNNTLSKQNKFKKNHKNSKNIPFNNYDYINSNNININSNTKIPNMRKLNQEDEKEHNIIDIELIIQGKDRRTTIMIKNIPNKYTISTFLDEINIDFKNKYDVFYLPIDYGNKCNLGFAFINFVDSFHIINFYDMYRGKKWKRFNSEKTCELLYAKIQGKKDLISHFEKGKVLSFESEDKRPLILPTPNPLPNIIIPMKYYEIFKKFYPYVHFICENEGKDDRKFIFNLEYLLYGK